MKALVIGATGAVGKDLVELLLKDGSFERVDVFVRREVKVPSSKLVPPVPVSPSKPSGTVPGPTFRRGSGRRR